MNRKKLETALAQIQAGLWYPLADVWPLGESGFINFVLPSLTLTSMARQATTTLVPAFADRTVASEFLPFGQEPGFFEPGQILKLVAPGTAIGVEFSTENVVVVPYVLWSQFALGVSQPSEIQSANSAGPLWGRENFGDRLNWLDFPGGSQVDLGREREDPT